MASRKKRFACGHRGKGRWCHRCADRQAQQAARVAEKQAWEGRLAAAPVSLAHCPRAVAEKALAVIAALERGESYLAFKGKRLTAMGRRDLVSIPLGWRYRLLARIQAAGLQILEVLSHEAYNTRLAANRWPT